jgi:hypothetical protein
MLSLHVRHAMNLLQTSQTILLRSRSRCAPLACLVAAVVLVTCPLIARAAGPVVPREHHVWAKFKPGAWTLLRTTTEELDSEGKVSSTSTAETRTTLVAVDDKGVDLRIERVIEVAGKRFVKKAVVVHQTLSGSENGQSEVVERLGAEEIVLDNRRIACDVRRVEIKKADMTRIIKVLYSARHSPYIMRREIDEKGGAGKAYQSITKVTALDMPYRVLNDIKPTAHSKTVLRNGKSVVTTISVMTMDVPGGAVLESSKEANSDGKLIRQTTVELADYGLEPPGESVNVGKGPERTSAISRFRARRSAKRDARNSAISPVVAPEPPDAASPDGPAIKPVSRRKSSGT